MTHREALVFSAWQMPIAELWAMRLDGDLFTLDDSFAALDEFDTQQLRAGALGVGRHPRLIAERWSAAWVWGALPAPPARHTFCARLDARIGHLTSERIVVREVAIDDDEERSLGGLRLTSPLRTVTDLARAATDQHHDQPVIAALIRIGQLTLADCLAALDRRPHLPHKRRAALLLQRAAATVP